MENCISKLILWNPTTNWYTILSDDYPKHGYDHQYDTGAIYHDQSNDLKVLHIKRRYNNVFASVYSRRFGIWRDVEFLNATNFGSSSYAWSVGTLSAKTVYFFVSQSWWVNGKKFIIAFDVLSETFKLINFPLSKDFIPSQGHLITLNRKIHMFVVSEPEVLIVELFKLEGEVWHKVLSFQNSQTVSFQSRWHQPHIMEYNTWILMSEWGHMVTVKLTGEDIEYIDVDNYHHNAMPKRPKTNSVYNDIDKENTQDAVLPIVTQDEAFHRRKLRKLYLDNKRSNGGTTSSSLNILSTNINSTSTPCVTQHRPVSPDGVTSDNIVKVIGCHNLESTPDVANNVTPSLLSMVTSNISCTTRNLTTRANGFKIKISTDITSTTRTSSLNCNLPRLSSGKRKLVCKPRISSPIPMIDLTTEETVERDPYKGVSIDYLDHGDQVITCEVCYANLWDAEKGNLRKEGGKISHMLCCGYAKVVLPDYKSATPYYKSLFMSNDNESRISGENYHAIGSLLPENGGKPKFCQLYIYDTENELANRCLDDASSSTSSNETDNKLIQQIKAMLDANNMLVKIYRMVRDCFQENPNTTLKLRLIGKREQDGRTYNLPTSSEVAALIVGDIDNTLENRDIVFETQTGSLKRISELHPSYLALQYPILFPYGDDGYRIDIPHRGVIDVTNKKRPNCTMREFFAYRVQDRSNQFSLILNSRRLFQQFLVDAYMMIESERLNFIRFQHHDLRSDTYESICKLRSNAQQDLSKVGKRIFLPSSFTGGSRYMMQNYLDAMAICKWYGYPDFFITITWNPKWPEVQRFLKDTNLNPEDRPDILSRMFKIKLDAICKDLKDRHLFGKAAAVVYTIEFQKRRLPHAHMCLFMENDYKLPTVDHVDQFISAEIPDINEDPELYTLVKDHMIHGPCGNARMSSPCMVDRKCSKGFPKKFQDQSTLGSNGFPLYRRRDDGAFVLKNKIELDNRSVVPYNKKLLKRYQAHINVEWCNQSASIKYLFKYINKGPDRATVAVVPSNNQDEQAENDEIKEYYDCRYISACEASWRIFSNEVNYRSPSVMRLPFHLPGQQTVYFGPDEDINHVLNKPSVNSSMFLSWMQRNQDPNDTVARTLTFVLDAMFLSLSL
ncbi:uncharacterized protein LOC118479584 [Helianthus annuus]|uniref:uncharacterized protein LOC118479584 n=1 Tax=Helianthus annuus TaxID=4232 RepID=UPI0016533560|nr:uncharacterized protein LOC118479584 [Helianthus annuus]